MIFSSTPMRVFPKTSNYSFIHIYMHAKIFQGHPLAVSDIQYTGNMFNVALPAPSSNLFSLLPRLLVKPSHPTSPPPSTLTSPMSP